LSLTRWPTSGDDDADDGAVTNKLSCTM
jgi:hypothetical protein